MTVQGFSPAPSPSAPQKPVQAPVAPSQGAPAPPAQSAAADPAYLAYLRGAGVEESEIQNILGTRVGALVRQLGRELPAYADKRDRAVEGAGMAAESRGLFRSGARMTQQNRAGMDVDRERMNFEASIRDQIAELYGTSALDIARLRRDLAEQGITGAQNVTLANAAAGIY